MLSVVKLSHSAAKITTQRTCWLIYTDFNIFIYRWTIDILSVGVFKTMQYFFKVIFFNYFHPDLRDCFTAEHVGIFLSFFLFFIWFDFCVFKNKHPKVFLSEARTKDLWLECEKGTSAVSCALKGWRVVGRWCFAAQVVVVALTIERGRGEEGGRHWQE